MSPHLINRLESFPKLMSAFTVAISLFAIGWFGHVYRWIPLSVSNFCHSGGEPTGFSAEPSPPRQTRRPLRHVAIAESSSTKLAWKGVATDVASQQSTTRVIVASGTVGFDQSHCAQIISGVSGTVRRVEKKIGDEVKSGDILAFIDSPEPGCANPVPLRSPFDGFVTRCDVAKGKTIYSAEPVYVVADTGRILIHLNIGKEDSNQLKVGTKVTVDSEGRRQPTTGILTWIGTEMDTKTGTVRARAEADNPLLYSMDASNSRRAHQINARVQIRIEAVRSQSEVEQ